ncbi:MAG: hypothetical protein Q7V20_05225 [Aquabacterium sp.]|uniref:hypothetical protein n=1 Tax=Aquabacterium sp. TaxID=1872578 RepID=UPI0027195172|nr:hypothetical protein [Aquabacterium sp.]MDO9002836.1 hypothetical protein [Aquabacterium sp.]
MSGSPSQMAVNRTWLQPRLVHLISGLRLQQVEEAVQLLLDYIDSSAAPAPPAVVDDAGRLLAEIRRKLADYHFALDTRQHGGGAPNALVSELESILATPWNPGLEATKRGPAS